MYIILTLIFEKLIKQPFCLTSINAQPIFIIDKKQAVKLFFIELLTFDLFMKF